MTIIHQTNIQAAQTELSHSSTPANSQADLAFLQHESSSIKYLYASIAYANMSHYDWPKDEYINTTLSDAIHREPALGKWLGQQTGLQLIDPQSGKAQTLSSLHPTEEESQKLFKALDFCTGQLLASGDTRTVSHADDAEQKKFEAFNEVLKNHHQQSGKSLHLSPENSQKLRHFINSSGGELLKQLCNSWQEQNAMLQEFRQQGTNKEHVIVDLNKVAEIASAMSRLTAKNDSASALVNAATALQNISNTLLPNKGQNSVPQENGEQKKNTQAAIVAFSALSETILSASHSLSQVKQFNPKTSVAEAATLYRRVHETEGAFQQALKKVKDTSNRLCGKGEFGWMLAFRRTLDTHQPALKIACDEIKKTLQNAQKSLFDSPQLQHSLMEKTIQTLSTLGSVRMARDNGVSVALTGRAAATQERLHKAGSALENVCWLVKMTLPLLQDESQNKPRQALQKLNSQVYEMAAVWQQMEAILPQAATLLDYGGDKEAANMLADGLQTLIDSASKGLESLSSRASKLQQMKLNDREISSSFQDIATRINHHKQVFDEATEGLRTLKHDLRPEKSAAKVALKKFGAASIYVGKNLADIGTGLKTLGSTALLKAESYYLSGEHKLVNKISADSVETQAFTHKLKSPVRGIQDALEDFRRKVADLGSAVSDKQAFGSKRAKEKQVKTERQLGHSLIAQRTERNTQKLSTVEQNYRPVQEAITHIVQVSTRARQQLEQVAKQYPQHQHETERLRTSINQTIALASDAHKTLDTALQQLKVPTQAVQNAAVGQVWREMTAMRSALANGLETAEQHELTAASNALQRASKAFNSAVTCLEKTLPDREGFSAAFMRLTNVMNDASLNNRENKTIAATVSIVREKMVVIAQMTQGWSTANARPPQQAALLPTQDRFADFNRTAQGMIRQTAEQLEALQYAFALVTGNRADPTSIDARIIIHLANFLKSQRDEVPEIAELYSQLVDSIVEDIAKEFKKIAIPMGSSSPLS
ncbi:hypothetical protein QRZ34_28545 [Klebsiella michiganensis]|uniref:hypothetical protein n=1 Tax=Klebsiella michiganensis TaxID=1134687 RepID=UPI00256FBE99|nr:hypothetical protein [Klebsiella michiganensis]MDL4454942.1 hypothetical protein [Klebsiella michiganensis]